MTPSTQLTPPAPAGGVLGLSWMRPKRPPAQAVTGAAKIETCDSSGSMTPMIF
jgi:hypothetical protein